MVSNPMRFLQRGEPINPLGQVIQRTKQEHHIAAFVRALEEARVTNLYTGKGSVWLRLGSLPRQFYMPLSLTVFWSGL